MRLLLSREREREREGEREGERFYLCKQLPSFTIFIHHVEKMACIVFSVIVKH